MNERVTKRLGLDKNGCRFYFERDDLEDRPVKVCPTPASWGGMIRWMSGMKVREGTKWNIFEETFDKRVPYSVHMAARDISEQEMYQFIETHYRYS